MERMLDDSLLAYIATLNDSTSYSSGTTRKPSPLGDLDIMNTDFSLAQLSLVSADVPPRSQYTGYGYHSAMTDRDMQRA